MALILNNLSSVSTLCLLLIVVSLQVFQSRGQSLEISASGSTCTQDCGPGYRCASGKCERRSCKRNCTGKAIQAVCGSDGVTYSNMCELAKARCEKAMHISAEYNGTCITLPPPPDHLCSAHQRQWDSASVAEYMIRCNYMEIHDKARAGTLQIEDVLPCYRPQCNGEKYTNQQCSYNAYNWCWCATDEGFVIPGTFEQDKPRGACDQRKTCDVSGVQYKDGDLFTPQSGCGFCECLNGEVTCFEDYVPNVSGQLNSTQLAKLKTELILLFYFQENREEHVLVDVRHIHRYPTTVSETIRQNILRWKFHYYDRNNDNILYPAEQFVFQTELYEFVRCSAIFDHVTDRIDEDSTGTISLDEWNRFFDENTSSGSTSGSTNGPDVSGAGSSSPVKRSVPASVPVMRKPLHRRKRFQYVLF